MDKSEKTILFIVIGVVSGCLLLAILCAAVFIISGKFLPVVSTTPSVPTPAMPTPTVCTVAVQDSIELLSIDDELLSSANETEFILENTYIPSADLNIIEERITGRQNIPTQLETPPVDYQIGDRISFYKMDGDSNNVLTSGTLLYATDTIYFWVEDDIYIEKRDLKTLVDIFSNEIYPTNHEFFGTEWIPGVDNDPHLYILYARGLGDNLAGYFSSEDYVLPEVNEFSNAREMFFINADEESLTDPYTLSTMAHELQHLIMGYRDPNEELWLNEGFSELATLINGYDAGGFDYLFTLQPDMQLNNWSTDEDQNDLNYGASYMFTTYLLSRFNEDITRAVVEDPLNGFTSIDHVFETNNIIDPSTNRLVTADEFFRDWTIANYLNDPVLLDGRYYYSRYDSVPTVNDAEWLNECQGGSVNTTVNQYGTDYYQIGCMQPVTINFKGEPVIDILPDHGENPTNFMWSNRADTSDMILTREFDLSGVAGSITFNFDLWYDLESDFDYGYIFASVDGGSWQVLNPGGCSTSNINGNNYGCAYSGSVSGWQSQTLDLSAFAGKKVALRFEVISDGALSNEGLAIDNLSIPEISYSEDFEAGDGGWVPEGFSRIRNVVPQTFLVSLITSDPVDPIKKYQVNPGEELNLRIDPYCMDSDPILVVSGSSRYTRQLAEYSITLTE